MNESKVLEWIGKYLAGGLSPSEKAALMEWVAKSADNRAYFEELIQLWAVSGNYDEPFAADKEAAWANIEARLSDETAEPPSRDGRVVSLWRRPFLRIAAAVLLALLAGYFWWEGPAEAPMAIVATGPDETTSVELPDGSEVWLNENSTLQYPEAFAARVVELDGEAFFEVAHRDGNPFVVRSGPARAEVLGTSFNVRAYPAESRIEVTVKTGKVALTPQKKKAEPLLLTPGMSGVYDKKEKTVAPAEQLSNATAWREQRLSFNDTPLSEVLRVLERYFDVQFELENEAIRHCRFSGPYDDPQLEDVLMTMEIAMNLTIEKTDEAYRISGAGCRPSSD